MLLNEYNNTIKSSDCCGCTACAAVCDHNAIHMKQDREGFFYPVFDAKKCISCGKCISVCSFKKDKTRRKYIDEEIDESRKVFLGRLKDYETVKRSRSGGLFTALSDLIIQKNGYIYGVLMDNPYMAMHKGTRLVEERNNMRGSKYVQSWIDDHIFIQIRERLENETLILFTGTSCQIAGLKAFLKKDYDNLICMDIVCHGVVSQMLLESYVKMWEGIKNAKCKSIDFRNKEKYGWKAHYETLYMYDEDGKDYTIDSTIYSSMYYCHYALRPSCYSCPYKTQEHPGDITIADAWGVDKVVEKYNDDKGCSLILINSPKGRIWFDMIHDKLDVIEYRMTKDLFQTPLHKSFEVDWEKREKFWDIYYSSGIKRVSLLYGDAAGDLILDKKNTIRNYMNDLNYSSEINGRDRIIVFGAGKIAKEFIPIINKERYEIEEIWDNFTTETELYGIKIYRPYYDEEKKNIVVFSDKWNEIKNELYLLNYEENRVFYYREFLLENAMTFYATHGNLVDYTQKWIYDEMKKEFLRGIEYEENRNNDVSLC